MRSADIPAHPDLIRLLEHYELLGRGLAMPRRCDFFPTQFSWMLGRMYLLDVIDAGADYRFRLFGDFWQTFYGEDLAGKTLSGLERDGQLIQLRPDFDTIVATGTAMYRPGRAVWPNGASFAYERLLLPFAGDDGSVSMILAAATCAITNHDLHFVRGLGHPDIVLDARDPSKKPG